MTDYAARGGWRPGPDGLRKFDALFPHRPALGAWADIPNLTTAEILARTGFDFLLIDLEHGPAAEETALAQIVASERWSVTPIVRVAEPRDPWIKKALDIGAKGIMAPAVHNRELAETAAAAARFGPVGRRGNATRIVRASGYGVDEDYESRWNDDAFLMVQVESLEAMENLEAIASTPGVDALFFGPADYAASAGYPGEAAVREAYDQVVAAAHEAGLFVGTVPFADLDPKGLIGVGSDIVTVASDISLLRKSAQAALAAVRGE